MPLMHYQCAGSANARNNTYFDTAPVDNHNLDDNAAAEQEWLQTSGISVMQVYRRATTVDEQHGEYPSATTRVISNGDEKVEFDLPLLLSMLEGALSEGEVQALQSRLEAFIKKKWIHKKDTTATKQLLMKEIERRYKILCICDEAAVAEESTGKPPKPSTSGNLTKLQRIMSNSADNDVRLVKSTLFYPTEKMWLVGELDRTLNAIQRIMEESEVEKGAIPRQGMRLMMRLAEGKRLNEP